MKRSSPRVTAIAMLLAAWLLAFAATAQTTSPDATLTQSEWSAIKRIIGEQLAALKKGDGDKAFSYASPGIRAQFGDAPTFVAMVREGYAALLDSRYTEFLDGAVIEGRVIQPMRVIAHDNAVVVALYTMEKHAGRWKIAGCVLAPSIVQAA